MALDDVAVTPTFVPPPQTIVVGTTTTTTNNVDLTPGSSIVTNGGTLQVANRTVVDELVSVVVNGQCQAAVGQGILVLQSATTIQGSFAGATLNCSDPCKAGTLVQSSTSVSVVVSTKPCSGGLPRAAIIGIAVGGAVLAIAIMVLVVLLMKRRHKKDADSYYEELKEKEAK